MLPQLVITVIFLLIAQLGYDDSPDTYYSNPIYVLLDQYMVNILIGNLHLTANINIIIRIFRHASVSSTYPGQSVRPSPVSP